MASKQYSETEAARQLGVPVEELRVLVRKHVVVDEAESVNIPIATYQPSDLLLLRLLLGRAAADT